MKKVINMIGKAVVVSAVIFIVWFAASWADVVTHNLEENPTYNEYNLFTIATENHS